MLSDTVLEQSAIHHRVSSINYFANEQQLHIFCYASAAAAAGPGWTLLPPQPPTSRWEINWRWWWLQY